jgi:hypothetical protein
MNLERADTLKEEANECFKSNQLNYQEYSAILTYHFSAF